MLNFLGELALQNRQGATLSEVRIAQLHDVLFRVLEVLNDEKEEG